MSCRKLLWFIIGASLAVAGVPAQAEPSVTALQNSFVEPWNNRVIPRDERIGRPILHDEVVRNTVLDFTLFPTEEGLHLYSFGIVLRSAGGQPVDPNSIGEFVAYVTTGSLKRVFPLKGTPWFGEVSLSHITTHDPYQSCDGIPLDTDTPVQVRVIHRPLSSTRGFLAQYDIGYIPQSDGSVSLNMG